MKKLAFFLCFALLLPLICIMPANAATEYKFGINAINKSVAEGQVLLLTPSFGETIDANGNNYSWCKVAVFDWSEEDEAYVLISLDTSLGGNFQKTSIIPPNGFALSVNLGNDYPALYEQDPVTYGWCAGKPNYTNAVSDNVFNNIQKLEIGTKVYLTGINLSHNSFEYTGDISQYYSTDAFQTNGFIHVTEEKPENAYDPAVATLLDSPVFKNTTDLYTLDNITVEWEPVEGATEYFVTVCNSTINANGPSIFSDEVSSTSITLDKSKLTVGAKYTVRAYASSDEGYSSISEYQFTVCEERALNSKFNGKTVVAFGDSITAWPGWVSMLYGRIGTNVINSGTSGDTTVHALARIEKDVIAKNPDLVIVNFGMNDQAVKLATGKNLTPIKEYEENYREIIEKIQKTGAKIVLVAVHDVCAEKYTIGDGLDYGRINSNGKTYIDRYNDVVKELAEEYGLGLIDINTLAEDELNSMILDGIHLNDVGQENYCAWISEYLLEYADKNTDWTAPNGSDVPNPGDASNTIVFVIIALVAVLGSAIVVRTRK